MKSNIKNLTRFFGFIFAQCVTAQAQFNYTNNGDGTCIITKYTGGGGAVDVPSMINTLKVTSIGHSAFYLTPVTSVTIPNSVTNIGNRAFDGCNLTNVYFSDSITSIGDEAFYQCSLTSVTIPTNVKNIGRHVFCNCHRLKQAIIPEGVTSIPGGTFYGCDSLTSITIPETVTSIRAMAFYDCSELASVKMLNKDAYIDKLAFYKCPKLTNMPTNSAIADLNESIRRHKERQHNKFAGQRISASQDIKYINNFESDPINGMEAAKTLVSLEYDEEDAYDGFVNMLLKSKELGKRLANTNFQPAAGFDKEFNDWKLKSEIDSDNDSISWNAVKGLGIIGDPRAIDALAEAMHNTNGLIAGDAALALGKIAANKQNNAKDKTLQERVRQILLANFHDEDGHVKKRGIYTALTWIGNPEDVVLFRRAFGHDVVFNHAPIYTNSSPAMNNVHLLVEFFAEAEIKGDQKLVADLGHIGGDKAIKEILYVLDNTHQNSRVRATAARTVGVALLTGRYPVSAEVKATALNDLLTASKDSDQEVSSSAYETLQKVHQ